jgi:hypothetical protein
MKSTHRLGKIKQLIDLNGDSINFEIKFTITSKNRAPFDVVVVNQTTLDNSSDLEYKTVHDGITSGTVYEDNQNTYQNYFIVLKANAPTDVEVEINKIELPMKPPLPLELPVKESMPMKPPNSSNYKLWLVLGTLVIAGIVFYYLRKRRNTIKSPVNNFKFSSHSNASSPPPLSHHSSPANHAPLQVKSVSPVASNSLIARLKRLHMG